MKIAPFIAVAFLVACGSKRPEASEHATAPSKVSAVITTQEARSPKTVTSTYTKLDLDRCQLTLDENTTTTWTCPGYAGVPIFVLNGDERFDISAGAEGEEDVCRGSPFCAFNEPDDGIEWRLTNGKPFAIIYRLLVSRDPSVDRKQSSRLLVETIGKGGCRIANIDGASKNANATARTLADAALNGPVRCIDQGE